MQALLCSIPGTLPSNFSKTSSSLISDPASSSVSTLHYKLLFLCIFHVLLMTSLVLGNTSSRIQVVIFKYQHCLMSKHPKPPNESDSISEVQAAAILSPSITHVDSRLELVAPDASPIRRGSYCKSIGRKPLRFSREVAILGMAPSALSFIL